MNATSHPTVHPVEAPSPAPVPAPAADNPRPRGRMEDLPGMPGTPGGLALRLVQFAFALVGLSVMASTSDFPSVTAFCFLVAATSLQSLWSLSLAIVDVYAIFVKRSLRNFRVVSMFAIGDGAKCNLGIPSGIWDIPRVELELVIWNLFKSYELAVTATAEITSTLVFSAACASAGITVLIGNDLNECAENHCARFQTATAMAFLSWFASSPSFLLNFWTLASK
ncbi:CASP-like protein 5A [Parasponia andersonii]|uniref:CASP-like protein n=1 Tax=Parasponia andersonii TaxID=3476 RepID=A0A2P5BMZ8_PARAD|nr:CASP-like protein 5A [Parasponia andersonii]